MADKTKTPITIEQAKKVRQAFQSALEGGQIVPQKALITKQIEAVSSESGTIQETPFIDQGTGTANGTSIVDTSPVGKHVEKQGNTVVVNSIVKPNFTSGQTLRGITTTLLSDGGWRFTGTCTSGSAIFSWNDGIIPIPTHKYLIKYLITDYAEDSELRPIQANGFGQINSPFFGVVTAGGNANQTLYTYWNEGQKADLTIYTFMVDLTQWFGSNDNIPQDLLDHPENAARYGITSDIAYNTGETKNSDGRYLECGQSRNVWDEQASFSGTTLSSTNYTMAIPNTAYRLKSPKDATVSYYDKNKTLISTASVTKDTNFTTPANCVFIKFEIAIYGSSYANDITISLYYTTGDSYDQYFPYVAPKTYDTGIEVLRSAGTVRDRKGPDGTIIRNVGVVDLGSLDWSKSGSVPSRFNSMDISSLVKKPLSIDDVANIRCKNYIADTHAKLSDPSPTDKTMSIATVNGALFINDTTYYNSTAEQFKAAMSGVMLYYELTTPTTEQGTPFSENIEINDYSYMSWKDTDSNLVAIPQGCKIFYPADYVLLIDSLNTLLNGDVDKIFTRYKHTIELRADSTDHIDLTFYFVSSDATKIEGASGLTFLSTNYKFMQINGLDSVNGQKIVGVYLWSGTTLQLLEIDGNNNMVFVTYSDITITGTPSDSVAEI